MTKQKKRTPLSYRLSINRRYLSSAHNVRSIRVVKESRLHDLQRLIDTEIAHYPYGTAVFVVFEPLKLITAEMYRV